MPVRSMVTSVGSMGGPFWPRAILTVANSRMAGAINFNSEAASGQLDMLGAFYGTDGQTLSGGIGGSLNGETMGGAFETSTRFREECCFELR